MKTTEAKEGKMSSKTTRIALIILVLMCAASVLVFAETINDFNKTYIVPAGYEVQSITPSAIQVGMKVQIVIMVVAYNSSAKEYALLTYASDNPQPVHTTKFVQQQ